MGKATYFIVHFTPINPLPSSTYGTSAPFMKVGSAIESALTMVNSGRRVFVTGRDNGSNILSVIPVVSYPVHGVTNLSVARAEGTDDRTWDAVSEFADAMNWTI